MLVGWHVLRAILDPQIWNHLCEDFVCKIIPYNVEEIFSNQLLMPQRSG